MYSKVYVEITNICNMNCSFCHGHSRASRRMTGEEFSKILTSLKGYTEYIYYHLMGEPLTHPELPEFLKMARSEGYKSIITTNGTLLEKRGEELVRAGLHKVNVSLHSFEDKSDDVLSEYIKEVAEFADMATKAGVIVVIRLWNKGVDDAKNAAALSELKALLSGEWKENTRGIRIREKLYLEWGERFEWPDKSAPVCANEVFCYGLLDHFGILCDGTVVPCCLDSDGVIALGNIFSEDIGSILRSERAVAMANGFKNRRASEELCTRCGYATRFVKK